MNAFILLAALTVHVELEDGRHARVRVEGEALAPGAVVNLHAWREPLVEGASAEGHQFFRTAVKDAGRLEAGVPLDCSEPGCYRVEASMEPDEQPEPAPPPGGWPEPASATAEVGMDSKAYLEAVIQAESALQAVYGEAGAMIDRMAELAKDPKAWEAWREEARMSLKKADARARDSARWLPSGTRLLGEVVRDGLLPQEERDFSVLKSGKPLPASNAPFKPASLLDPQERLKRNMGGVPPGQLTRQALEDSCLQVIRREALLQRLVALKALLASFEKLGANPALRERKLAQVHEALELLDDSKPLAPVLAAARAWMEADEARAAALKKDLGAKFQKLRDSVER